MEFEIQLIIPHELLLALRFVVVTEAENIKWHIVEANKKKNNWTFLCST